MKICLLLFVIVLNSFTGVLAQESSNAINKDAAYTQTITNRAEKIVQTLEISDSSKAKRVTNIIASQYRNLNTLHTERDDQIAQIKQKDLSKEIVDSQIKTVRETTDKKLSVLHNAFLTALSHELSQEQVTKVKDGMTYNVLKVTYTAYSDMIPSLTKEQKDQIMTWLVEAREQAMDAENSEKKHAWFGKYKGRINNYLSAEGYDLKKEREGWQQRIKEREEKKNVSK